MLLDSHVVLWLVAAPGRLGATTVRLIEQATAAHVSAVSFAEFAIKAMLGHLAVPDDLPARLAGQGLTHLPFTAAHAQAMSRFPELARQDPFDRMLVAQAAAEGMKFLTADRRLLGLGYSWVQQAATD